MLCFTATEGRATARAAGAAATAQVAAPSYARHVSERTLLHALVQAHYPDFIAHLEAEDRSLPKHVQAGVERASAQCGAVTLIQRFGSVLNLNVHFHMLWLDGVHEKKVEQAQRKPRLHRTRVPTGAQAGRKVLTLQTLPDDAGLLEGDAGKVGGFSLHAGVAAEAHESQKLERLCR